VRLNLNDPASICAWFHVNPSRHGPMLKHWLTVPMFEQFRPAIVAARGMVR
jgi:hypothetical protein